MKKLFKKTLAMLLAAVMVLSLAACKSDKNLVDDDETVTTTVKETTAESTTQETTVAQTEATTQETTTAEETTAAIDPAAAKKAQEEFDEYLDALFIDMVGDNALGVHYSFKNPEDYGIVVTDYTLGDISDEAIAEAENDVLETLEELKSFNPELLTESQQLYRRVLISYYETSAGYVGLSLVENNFGSNSGYVANIPTNFIEFVFDDEEDIEVYLENLKDTDRYVNDLLKFTRRQAEAGYFMSEACAQDNIDNCTKYLENEVNPLIASFDEKVDAADFLTAEKKAEYKAINADYIEKYYNVSYQNIIDTLSELVAAGYCNNEGLCSLKDGEKLYEAIVRKKTSTDMTPAELAKFLDDAMDDLISDLYTIWYSDATIDDRYAELTPNMTDTTEILKFLADACEASFPAPVTKEFVVNYMSKATEIEGTMAYYLTARFDQLDYNSIKVNGSAVEGQDLTLYTTLAHEGFPGHLYQFTSVYGNDKLPMALKLVDFISFTEGFAEYTSDRAYAFLGCDDTLVEYAILNDVFGYILQSRIDVGVNYEGWSREDVFDYCKSYIMVSSVDDTNPIYDSVVSDPGLLFPYTVGHLLLNYARENVINTLGDAFDEIEYHQFILDLGIVPFDVFDEELEKYLDAKLGGTYERPTEAATEEPTEAVEEDVYTLDGNKLSVLNVDFVLPEGAELFSENGAMLVFAVGTDYSICVFVQNDNTVDSDLYKESMIAQGQSVYGDTYGLTCTPGELTVAGKDFSILTLEASDLYKIDGYTAIYVEGENVVYVEYITTSGAEVPFEEFLSNIVVK